jgi:hypothetical protein
MVDYPLPIVSGTALKTFAAITASGGDCTTRSGLMKSSQGRELAFQVQGYLV